MSLPDDFRDQCQNKTSWLFGDLFRGFYGLLLFGRLDEKLTF